MFLLFCLTKGFSQADSIKTVVLQELIVEKTNMKTTKYKALGKGSVKFGFGMDWHIISLMNDIPSGQLQAVTFYFNKRSIYDGVMKANYSTNNFELLIYTVKDNQPEKKLIEKELIFSVNDFDKGKITLNVSDLDISVEKELFIGFRKLDKTEESNFNVMFRKNPKGITLIRSTDSHAWTELPSISDSIDEKATLKVELTIK